MLFKFASWLGQKLLAAAIIVLLAVALYGAWLYLEEEGVSEKRRLEQLAHAIGERDRLLAAQAAVEQSIAAIRAEVENQQKRMRQAEKVMTTLRELESWWERWFGNREQQTANVERMRRMEALKGEATTKAAELQRTITQVIWEKDGIEAALRRANAEVGQLEVSEAKARGYLRRAWESTKWWIAIALGSFFFGPTLWALAMYFAVAPLLSRGRPIRIAATEPSALPAVGESRVSVEVAVTPGETLRIKEKFLQASDEGILKRTRFVLDWRIPFTSLACGLVEMIELQHPGAAGEFRVTLSNGDDPHVELAQIAVPAGGSLVLRPRFLAGVIQGQGERLEIRRHWRLLHWQAWITGQFRFFEFVGPCRLIVSGSRGVRAERLAEREGVPSPARRTNQDATIGFTPHLEYRPVRAETFWSYYRGMNPLFDDLFAGRGVFVLQDTASDGSAAAAGRFWSGIWSGVLKVFGL